MSDSDELGELRGELSHEADPARREEIVSLLTQCIQIRWDQLFRLISKEDDPQRMLLLLAELRAIIDVRRTRTTEEAKATHPDAVSATAL